MLKKHRAAAAALVACLGLLVALSATLADESGKKGDNKGNNFSNKPGTTSEMAMTVKHVALSNMLITYGRKHKSADALLMAAEILGHVPPSEMKDEKPKTTNNAGGSDNNAGNAGNNEPADAGSNNNNKATADPATLAAEAKKMAPDDKCIAERADKVSQGGERPRGEVRGAQRRQGTVPPGFHQDWNFTFKGGEVAVVTVLADGAGPVSLYVYDENENLITQQAGLSPWASWTPKWTGPFTIRVQNENDGKSPVSYTLTTN